MPTYRYECRKCSVVHEIFHGMTETRRKCPECGGKLERLIGAGGGVLLKGQGFHNTDYRSESYKKAEKKEKEAGKKAADSGGKGEGKKAGDGAKKSAKKKAKD
jgi:putative FmdB family regulatory protein